MLKFEWTKKHTTILVYTMCTILLAVALIFAILFPSVITGFIGDFFSAISPAFFGFVIAYMLHPICNFFEYKCFAKAKLGKRLIRIFSVLCTLIVFFAVISLFIGIMAPQIATSYLSLQSRIETLAASATQKGLEIIENLRENDKYGIFNTLFGNEKMESSLESMIGTAFGFVGTFANTVLEYSSRIVVVVAKAVVSFIFAVYFLLEKERLLAGISKLSTIVFSARFNNGAKKWIHYTDEVFSSFISGKIINSMIITVVNFVVFGLFGIPYYPLVALVCGITDMIPYFGPFIGAIPCAFIILIADPIKVIWFAALVLVIQQLDGNVLSPKILGEKVGVDSFLIIIAITVSGGLFGVLGMFVGVPVFTVAYAAVTEFLSARLKKKGLPTSTAAYSKKKEAAK